MITQYLRKLRLRSNMEPSKKAPCVEEDAVLKQFAKEIGAISLTYLQAGNSKDRKYEMFTKDGGRYFLRIASSDRQRLFEQIFAVRTELFRAGGVLNAPVSVGTCPFGCYLLEPWLSGDTLLNLLQSMGESAQYEKGWEVGSIISTFHGLNMNMDDIPPLTKMFSRVMNRFKKTEYDLFGCRQKIIWGIEETLQNRQDGPSVLLHGDFHLNNIILDNENNISIVDFESVCVGDPLWDSISVMDSYRLEYPFRSFNEGFIAALSKDYLEDDWAIMASYCCLRKIKEYMFFQGRLTERLSTPSMWKMYCGFINNPSTLKAWLMNIN